MFNSTYDHPYQRKTDWICAKLKLRGTAALVPEEKVFVSQVAFQGSKPFAQPIFVKLLKELTQAQLEYSYNQPSAVKA